MKKLSKLKLNSLAQGMLNEQEMNILRGGGTPGNCNCGCGYYGQPGGSSDADNSSANNAQGYPISYGYPGNGGGSGGDTNNCFSVNGNWGCDIEVNCNHEPSKC